jgi:hypothetical protein
MQISINSTQGNKLVTFTQEKNWYRMDSRNSVGEAYTSKQYLSFYAKALELNTIQHYSMILILGVQSMISI